METRQVDQIKAKLFHLQQMTQSFALNKQKKMHTNIYNNNMPIMYLSIYPHKAFI